jgi:hypothetical protein
MEPCPLPSTHTVFAVALTSSAATALFTPSTASSINIPPNFEFFMVVRTPMINKKVSGKLIVLQPLPRNKADRQQEY